MSTSHRRSGQCIVDALARAIAVLIALGAPLAATAVEFREIQPLLVEYCHKCHSTEKQKGDLDLERFTSIDAVKADPQVWQLVEEQLALGEMPPKEKPQLKPAERERLVGWVEGTLSEIARAHAGDPGPVVLRRLSNAEYTYTVRDLTEVGLLDPAREFPVDGAAGEGFTNAGAALVMSPALFSKYLEGGKEIARHAVLLPNGLRFSPHTSERDWTEEALAAIRAFYGRFTATGSGTAVNLQGVKFDTNAGGVLPLEKYLTATLAERDSLASGAKTITAVAEAHRLNAKYLGALWTALNGADPSLLLDPIRSSWRAAKPEDAARIEAGIAHWQKTLWRFTTVGQIGRANGPKAWQVPVSPLATSREFRVKLPAASPGQDVTIYLAASDAGDGGDHDFAVWENPRLAVPGQPDLPLRDVRGAINALTTHRRAIFSSTAQCLAAAAEADAAAGKEQVAKLAEKHRVDPAILGTWFDLLGIGGGEVRIDSPMTQKLESAEKYDFIKGWTGADALSVIANSSDQHVRVPGNMKPHSVAVHPAPKHRVIVGWRSPVAATVRASGTVQHAHPECGNGVTWSLELRRAGTRQRLAKGTAHGANPVKFGAVDPIAVLPGDIISVVIGPRDGNHSCDLTALDFELSDGARTWNLAKEISPNILAGNPHSDSFGHPAVWNFYSEAEQGDGQTVLPGGSLLAKWQSNPSREEKARLAGEVQELLLGAGAKLPADSPDAVLFRQLASLNGPLISAARKSSRPNPAANGSADSQHGLDPSLFGKHPSGGTINETSLCVRAPSVLEIRLPAELVAGCEFVTTGALHKETGSEGSVQMQILTKKPANDVQRLSSDAPILVVEGSAAGKRIERALDEFRQLFPAALCYAKIVPVDEVITLTLYHREDDHLSRLMLDEAQAAELDRLWAELRYVSRDSLKMVDAFEQLWQYATQDADPKAFEPLREPIKQRASEFQRLLVDSQGSHLEAVLRFASSAWRRPLVDAERDGLRAFYRELRSKEIPHDEAVRLTIARIFVAPAFLYKMEKPAPGTEQSPVHDYELASRLSYFLWSSAPDAALLADAANGKLREPGVLGAQARRMLADPRVRRLAVEFGAQWLHVRDFDKFDEKSERAFPTFNALRAAMNEEPILFFTDLFQGDRSILSLLDADHTYVNGALAGHYGFAGINGEEWRRVDGIRARGRGGIIGFAATLAKQSGASRTSPILRGNWLSETILGERLPRPPKDVPVLPDEAPVGLTERQLTEKHSSDPSCARCHVRIDPFGFALEEFDAIGRFRAKDVAGLAIDARAKLADGTELDGLHGVRDYLLTKRRETFERQFCRKLLGYALGRGVILSDQPLLDEMLKALSEHDHRVGVAIEKIVQSRQFRDIRGAAFVSNQ